MKKFILKKGIKLCSTGLGLIPTVLHSQNTVPQDSLKTKNIEAVTIVSAGYGKQKKAKTSGAVTSTNLDNIAERSLQDVASAIQGKTPGVVVTNEGGDPTSTPSINIRGLGGVNGEKPLYVVDDVLYETPPIINPNDIESINVVKDATAAIYGARAAGGVVFITTKKGRKGRLQLSFDVKQGFQNAWKLKKSLNAEEFQSVMSEAFTNAGKPIPDAFDPIKNPDGRITRTDWIEEIFRTGSMQEYNIDLSGGNNLSHFFMSFNYRNQEGILLNTYSDRYNFRLNSDYQIKPWLKIGESLNYSSTNGNGANTNDGYIGAILSAIYYVPSVPVYDENGNYSGLPIKFSGSYGDMINPVAYLNRIDRANPIHNIMINPYVEIDLSKNLKFKSNFALKQSFTNSKDVKRRRLEIGKIDNQNRVAYTTEQTKDILAEQILTFDKNFNGHRIEVTGVFSFQKSQSEGFAASIDNFPQESNTFMYLQNGRNNKQMSSYIFKKALMSSLLRLNYDYRSKYIVSVLGRRDGSSLLPKNNRFENYYAISGAWNIAKEEFLRNSNISTFKLRASHGLTGNLGGIDINAIYPLLSRFENIIFGSDPAQNTAYFTSNYGNPNLKWGSSRQTDIGIDLGLLRDRLFLTIDYFNKSSLDQIMSKPLPSTSGYTTQFANGGEFRDSGLEFGLNYKSPSYRTFKYSFNANFNTLKNEIVSLAGPQQIALNQNVRGSLKPIRLIVGESLYSYYGYKTGGIFQSQKEIDNYRDSDGNLLQPNAKPGDFKFLKADGSTGPLDPAKDFVNLGNPFPKLSYAFSANFEYKNWDLSVFFQGVYGNKIFNGLKFITLNPAGVGQNYNMDRAILGSWSPNNPNSTLPRLVAGDPSGNYTTLSDFYVEDGSYLRLKNISLGYTLPTQTLSKYGINKVKIYTSASNVFTITKYTGFDPEVGIDHLGIDQGRYPQARNFILGVNISL